MKQLFPALKIFAVLTLITGLAYPLFTTLIGQVFFDREVNGSLVEKDGNVIGSMLISQKFVSDRYFFSRPSAGDYNPLPSGGTNLAPTSKKLKESAAANRKTLGENAPQDLIYASGSGLDPHISPEAAIFQVDRVATARAFSDSKKLELMNLVKSRIEKRDLGLFGEQKVNVLELNLAVDRM